MAVQSITSIWIGSTEISYFKSLELHQNIKDHHHLKLVCRMDVLEGFEEEQAKSSKDFLGQVISLEISPSIGFEGAKELLFKGVVTGVQSIKGFEAGDGDEVIISAKSPTVLASDGAHFTSYNDVSLSGIIHDNFQLYDTSKLSVLVRLQNDPTIHYSVQHNESSFAYASRLAAMHGEWMYYDGVQLIFGKPDQTEVALTYGFDLKEYELKLEPQSSNYTYFANDYLTDQVYEQSGANVNTGLRGYGDFVSGKSAHLFHKETKIWHNLHNSPQTQQRLDRATEIQIKAIALQQVIVRVTSDNTGVKLGGIVTIEGNKYRVVKITHTNTETGEYLNKFEAITTDINTYPYTDINAFPKSESQTAVVKYNDDPDGLGRVKVQFVWQKITGEISPWIRMVQPHGGADKGFYFIPEINEEVLVGFEGGNAEYPYVLGSLYNGSQGAGAFQSKNNDIKAIKTRGGHLIEFKDTNGEETITILDKSGNKIVFDVASSSINISAPSNITLSADTIQIKAKNEIKMFSAESSIAIEAKQDIGMHSKDSKLQLSAKEDVDIRSKNANLKIKAKNTTQIVGNKTVDVLAGNELKMHGKSSSKLTGGKVFINKG